MTSASFIPKYHFFEKASQTICESFMKFSADFVCQLYWRIDCRADETRYR